MMASRTFRPTSPVWANLRPAAGLPAHRPHIAPVAAHSGPQGDEAASFADLLAPHHAARRILLNPSVSRCWKWTGSRSELVVPSTPMEASRILAQLPDVDTVHAVAARVEEELDRPVEADEVATAVLGALALVPGVKITERAAWASAMIDAISIEADLAGWSSAVVAAALYEAVKATGFAPSLKEALTACVEAKERFRTALRAKDRVIATIAAMTDAAAQAGHKAAFADNERRVS